MLSSGQLARPTIPDMPVNTPRGYSPRLVEESPSQRGQPHRWLCRWVLLAVTLPLCWFAVVLPARARSYHEAAAHVAESEFAGPGAANAGNIRVASRFPGADLGAQINAASRILGQGHGEIWVEAQGTVRTPVKLLPGQTLRLLAPTTWQTGAALTTGDRVVGDGAGSLLTVSYSKPAAVFSGSELSDVRISGLSAAAPASSAGSVLVSVTASDRVTVSNCGVRNLRLFESGSSAKSYAQVDEANSSRDVRVVNNTAVSEAISRDAGAAISLAFTWRAVVSGNITRGFNAGVQWWGGDANYNKDGVTGNKRKTGNLTISNNVATDNGGSGVWGSMGDGVIVAENAIRSCGDVCLDAEGSNHVVFSGNVVQDGRNGAISTFFYNSDVTISGNSVVSSSPEFPLLSIYNSSQSSAYNKDLLITGNHFNCTGNGICVVSTSQGPAQQEIFTDNILRDAKLQFTGNNQHYVEVSHNDFVFDLSSRTPFNAIDVERTNSLNGEPGTVKITDNMIDSQAAQPKGSRAIYVRQDDYNSSAVTWIESNQAVGLNPFPIGIAVDGASANSGVLPVFFISRNVMGAGAVLDSGGPHCRCRVVLQDNLLLNGVQPPERPRASSMQRGAANGREVSHQGSSSPANP